MRSKALLIAMGLVAGSWISGCQNLGQRSTDAGKASCSSCATSASAKASLRSDLNTPWYERTDKPGRLASRATKDTQAKDATACSTCSTCGTALAKNKENAVAAGASCASGCGTKSPPVAIQNAAAIAAGSSCNTCSTNATKIASAPPSLPNVPAGSTIIQLPPAPGVPTSSNRALPEGMIPVNFNETLPPGIVPVQAPGSLPTVSLPTNPAYGAGVEVVNGGHVTTAPTAPPGEAVVTGNTVTVRFGQSNNYQTVVGQVYQFRRTWRLRFTAVESEDIHGGSFTLVGDNLDSLQDGQMVRVQGNVIPSDDRAGGSRYQVSRLEVLDPSQR